MAEQELQKIIDVELTKEMKKSYIDYAMSVIVSRALPDVRDGLKPFTGVSYTQCMRPGLRRTSRTKNVRRRSVMYSVSTTRTATRRSTMLWCGLHRTFPCATASLMDRATLVVWTATRRLLTVIRSRR